MRHPTAFVFVASLLVTALPIQAQAQERRVNFSIGGGYTAPNSEVRDHLGDGYNFNIGLQANVTPVIGIEGIYSFNGLGQENIVGERSSTDFGMDFGGGVNFAAVYAELRYHYIWGPEVSISGPGGNRYRACPPIGRPTASSS
jgi:hypothetical protein